MNALAVVAFAGFVAGSAHAATFTVINNDDSGAGSLRDAIAQSNATAGPNTINFNPSVTGTIVLTSGQLFIFNGPVTVAGPGAGVLAIDGNANDRVIAISDNPEIPCPGPTGPNNFRVTVSGLTIKNGNRTASNSGGGIVSTKDLTLQNMVFQDNKARFGGGVAMLTQYPGQTLSIQNSQFINNAARALTAVTAFGGGLHVSPQCTPPGAQSSTVTIDGSLFQGNHTQPANLQNGAGGGINISSIGDVTLTNSRVIDNHVDIPATPGTTSYAGGGMDLAAKTVTIRNSEIADNSAGYGGGFEVYNSSATRQGAADTTAVLLSNSTVSGNIVSQSGGAVNLYANVATQIVNSTVSNNTAATTRTGGVRVSNGVGLTPPTLTLVSSILANSSSGTVDFGGLPSTNIPSPYTVTATNSLIQTFCALPDCIIAGTGNLTGVDPMVGPLTFNGGSTRTQALLTGSPVINAGSNPDGLPNDQRGAGFPRVIGATADMGAYEYNPSVSPVLQSAKSRKVRGGAGTFDLLLTP